MMSKFIGLVSAYAYAKSKGYTGTEEEFAILMAEYASVTETAVEAVRIATESAQSAAAASSDVNKAAATVTQQAAQVHDDAETSSESAATASEAKETAVDKALDSEAWAVGTRDGEDVGTSDPAYHNNAKYYAESVSASAQTASNAAQTATTKAGEAQASASAAAESARTLTIDATLTQSGQAADSKVVGDAVEEIDGRFDTESHVSQNLLNPDEIGVGGYYWTDGFHESASYNYTPYIPVEEGQSIYLQTGYKDKGSRDNKNMRFVVGYDSDKQVVTSSAQTNSNPYIVPQGVSYIICSIIFNILTSIQYPVLLASDTGEVLDYIPYFEPYKSAILKDECNNEAYIKTVAHTVLSENNSKAIFSANADSLPANTNLICCNSCGNKKNEYIELTAEFSSFGELTIAHGKTSYGGGYIIITSAKILIYSYNGTLLEEFEHGLSLSDFINVIIYTKNDQTCRSSITIMTAGGDYTAETTRYYSSRAAVLCNATFAMTNVKIRYTVNDAKEDVWVFGDSYVSLGDPQRWATQLVSNGHKNLMIDGFGGATSANAILSFMELLTVATPKYIVWCLGMNNPDNGAVNTSWKSCVEEVTTTCEEKGITLILATIPNCPTVDNTYKNAYVRESGLRYVDFAKAVNAESAESTWYEGMLSSDNTHPATLGAKALMRQFILDVPEVLYAEK